MKRSILAAAAIAFSLTTFAPVQAGGIAPMPAVVKAETDDAMVHKAGRRRRGRGLAIGAGIVTLGILGAIAASRHAKAHDDYYYEEEDYYYEHRQRCKRWRRACRHGSDRACWRFDTRC